MEKQLGKIPFVAPSEYTNKSRVIHAGPCIVCCVMISGEGVNADCQVYDGVNANGKLRAHIEALSGTTFHWHSIVGTDFDHGIYIVVNASTTHVTVTYIPESRKKFI